MEGPLTSAGQDTCLISLLDGGQYVAHLAGQVTKRRNIYVETAVRKRETETTSHRAH